MSLICTPPHGRDVVALAQARASRFVSPAGALYFGLGALCCHRYFIADMDEESISFGFKKLKLKLKPTNENGFTTKNLLIDFNSLLIWKRRQYAMLWKTEGG